MVNMLFSAGLAVSFIPTALALCPPPGPLLPPPTLNSAPSNSSIPKSSFNDLPYLNDTSFAIKASIGKTIVFQHEHSAPGREVPQSLFETQTRIASVTKMFTALALLLSDDKISLEDPITKFVLGLEKELYEEVTVGELTEHNSGLGRFGYTGDLALTGFDASALGLPWVNNTLPGCDASPDGRMCNDTEIMAMFNHPLYAPHSPSSGPLYSNIGYNLLGMALEAVHHKSYEAVIQALILGPLEMKQTTFTTPQNNESTILLGPVESAWTTSDLGNHNPTGGLWSTPNELLSLLQGLLNHQLLTKAKLRKWLQPRALLRSSQQFIGMSWEILRPTDLDVAFPRPIEIYKKTGDLPGYGTYAALIPEYDMALTIHAAGDRSRNAAFELFGLVIKPLVTYADQLARQQAATKYAGTYELTNGNTTNTITLTADDGPGLAITRLTINGAPVLRSLASMKDIPFDNFSARLYPTDPDSWGTGVESWKMLLDLKTSDKGFAELDCASFDWGDNYRYMRESLDTFIFSIKESRASSVELRAWRIKLDRQSNASV